MEVSSQRIETNVVIGILKMDFVMGHNMICFRNKL